MPDTTAVPSKSGLHDRELLLVATSLERLAARVQACLDPDAAEGPAGDVAEDLLEYVQRCVLALDDPVVMARLNAAVPAY